MAPIAMIASVALGAAQLAKAGSQKMPDPAKAMARAEVKAEDKRRRLVRARAGQRTARTSVLAGDAPDPMVRRPRLLGEA